MVKTYTSISKTLKMITRMEKLKISIIKNNNPKN